MGEPLILATDLDGTMAHGTAAERRRLAEALAAAHDTRLVYVTGRTAESARELVAAQALPVPDVLIADVGTSVLHGIGPERVQEIEAELDARWPGAAEVRRRLRSMHGLMLQDVDAPRRVSYWVEDVRRRRSVASGKAPDPFAATAPGDASLDADAERIAATVAQEAVRILHPLDVDVLVSANVFLDVLPRGVNKGSTLRRVLRWMGGDEQHCVVAGDSLNDLSLFETGLRGIVVGNCEPALRQRVADIDRVYCAAGSGAAGILEGLRHFGHVRGDTANGRGHAE